MKYTSLVLMLLFLGFRPAFAFDKITKVPRFVERDAMLSIQQQPNKRLSSGHAPLVIAAMSGSKWEVKTLLGYGASVGATSKSGITALDVALYRTDILSLLLEYAEDKDIPTSIFWRAASSGLSDAVEVLKEHPVTRRLINTRDPKHGHTPLMWAAKKGHTDVVKVLLKNECVSIYDIDEYGHTAAALAKKHGRDEIVDMIEQAQIDRL